MGVMNYIGYFIVSLLYNIVLLAFYIVQVAIRHPKCIADDKVDVTG